MTMTHFSNLIKERRESLNLTQTQVCKSINVHFQQLSGWEKSRVPFPLKHAKRLCKALKLDRASLTEALLKDFETDIANYLK